MISVDPIQESPWTAIPASRPFVLSEDEPAIARFNASTTLEYRIELDALPEPFIGPLDAPVVLLSLNPGWNVEDPLVHARSEGATLIRCNLAGEANSFYYFDPSLSKSPGAEWWRQRLGPVVSQIGEGAASHIMVVEWFPYHSRRFHRTTPKLASQEYSAYLVRRAIRRNAWIVCMRAERAWKSAVRELVTYERFTRLNSPQNVTVSPKNCPRFSDLTRALADSHAS